MFPDLAVQNYSLSFAQPIRGLEQHFALQSGCGNIVDTFRFVRNIVVNRVLYEAAFAVFVQDKFSEK